MSLDREAGFYNYDGAGVALADQQRADIIETLRVTKAASVTALEAEGGSVHWGFHADPASEPEAFLVFAVVKAWRDMAAATGDSDEQLHGLIQAALDAGIGL